ncbi:ALQxL family class IV lanthipeptide [Micromonospora sp. BRA006-A]|nr:ALQxL family class IV lanthipeptide [Micromonospora sp. BRA006-A]MDW3846701.1 ALQxL family class IV lanthipeptide [Micromonospora sp. BRA006-A]MEE3920137.1 ALQxL family class IV lanthipeptide [Micromonospora sp. BRA006-A]
MSYDVDALQELPEDGVGTRAEGCCVAGSFITCDTCTFLCSKDSV